MYIYFFTIAIGLKKKRFLQMSITNCRFLINMQSAICKKLYSFYAKRIAFDQTIFTSIRNDFQRKVEHDNPFRRCGKCFHRSLTDETKFRTRWRGKSRNALCFLLIISTYCDEVIRLSFKQISISYVITIDNILQYKYDFTR